jgi:hypothetical protein
MATDYGNKSIVTDGLIFNVDASNKQSYPGSGTTALDFIGGFNGNFVNDIAVNSPSPSNFEFGLSGVDDYIDFLEAGASPLDPQTNNYTANVFYKIDSENTATSCIMGKGCGSSNVKGWLMWWSESTDIVQYRVSGRDDTTQRANVNFSLNKNQIYMSTLVIDRTNSQIIGYLDGTNPQTASISGFDSFLSSNKFLIGIRHQLNLAFNGRIYLAQIYNKALSASEVLQNYNAHKERFGL